MNSAIPRGVRAVFAVLSISVPLTAQGPGAPPFDQPVKARLVADVASVTAGQAFTVGVELRMDEGWHTYWQYSGDAGLPTSIEWDMPDGFEPGSLQWPGPHKYEELDDLFVYGYADEVLLMSDVGVAANLDEGLTLAPLSAQVSWLVCREVCIPGGASLALQLPVGAGSPVPLEERDLFDRYRTRVPTPLGDDDPVEVTHHLSGTAEGVYIVDVQITSEEARQGIESELPDFFPSAAKEADPFPGRRSLAVDGSVNVAVELEPLGASPPSELDGVVVFEAVDGAVQYRSVKLDLRRPTSAGKREQGGLLEVVRASRADAAEVSLALYLLLAIAGGLILNLMPCVLPVISLKILGFVSQAGEEKARIRQLGFMFSAGVVATFVALAAIVVLLKAGGEQIGWGFQFQSPAFVLFLTALVFVLGLSLFGVVTVRLPGSSGGLVGGAAQSEGLGGSFFNGVLATILATPCTAPFLGTSLGFAFSQSTATIFAIFLAAGIGMSLPYVALALQPGWTRFIPTPGDWMERFKQLMAFLLMATAVWLLWVLGKQLGMEAVVWSTAFLLCLGVASWIVGQWVEDLRASRGQRVAAWAGAFAVSIAGYALFVHPLLAEQEATAQAGAPTGDEAVWQPFSVELVEQLVAADRHVFVDFTAEWCWTCKVNKRAALDDGRVRARFAELDVALVRADWTNRNPEITDVLSAFGRPGVPLYVIFPAGRADHPLVLPEILTPGLVLQSLEEAASLRGQQQ